MPYIFAESKLSLYSLYKYIFICEQIQHTLYVVAILYFNSNQNPLFPLELAAQQMCVFVCVHKQ